MARTGLQYCLRLLAYRQWLVSCLALGWRLEAVALELGEAMARSLE
jgi:hypothetical protein